MKEYLELLGSVMDKGVLSNNRTGTRAIRLFGGQIRINLENGFPILTTKKIFFRGAFEETIFFIKGLSDNTILKNRGIHIWDAWEKENGELGPVYGVQWRKWGGHIDQLQNAINTIKKDPDSRRIVVSAWNPAELDDMALPPCHMSYQFSVMEGKLSCHMYQRSADLFLGVPFNIAGYALLTHIVASITNLGVGDLIVSYGDLHIYENHIDAVKKQLKRIPWRLPRLSVSFKNLDDVRYEGIKLMDYVSYGAISGDVAV